MAIHAWALRLDAPCRACLSGRLPRGGAELHIRGQASAWYPLLLDPPQVVPFPLFELQSALVARVLSGRAALPSRASMAAEAAAFYSSVKQAGLPARHTHMMSAAQVSGKADASRFVPASRPRISGRRQQAGSWNTPLHGRRAVWQPARRARLGAPCVLPLAAAAA
jgi:hypothetical protein